MPSRFYFALGVLADLCRGATSAVASFMAAPISAIDWSLFGFNPAITVAAVHASVPVINVPW